MFGCLRKNNEAIYIESRYKNRVYELGEANQDIIPLKISDVIRFNV